MDEATRTRVELLSALCRQEGEWVSSATLAERLGRSRTAISNHVAELRSLGYEIESATARGYRLCGLPDLVHPVELWRHLGSDSFISEIHFFDETDSTSTQASRMAEAGAPHGTLVIAERQSAGRGRLGRSWSSPAGVGLYFSLILRPRIEPHRTPQLTLLAAVALARTIESRCGRAPQIKWPNDLLFEGRKFAGILTEMAGDVERVRWVNLGIGINVHTVKLPDELAEIATSLKLTLGEAPPRAVLLRAFFSGFAELLEEFEAGSFEHIRSEWERFTAMRDQRVRVSAPGGEKVEGIARGLDTDGALLLEVASGEVRRIIAGDVNLARDDE